MCSLGVAMLAQNEESHMPATIAQFYNIADEIVVVDGGSSDQTTVWAERMGAKVLHRPFRNDFSDQKNFAISQLKTDWVYLHDPDERLEPTLLEILPHLITDEGQKVLGALDVIAPAQDVYDCFGFARKNFIDGVQTNIYPDYQYRLFRPYCRYSGKVHEMITNFKLRTEVDYTRPKAVTPKNKAEGASSTIDTERGQVETGVNLYDPTQISRFNILHFKSSKLQEKQDLLYKKIQEGV